MFSGPSPTPENHGSQFKFRAVTVVDRTSGARAKLLAVYVYLETWFAEDTFRGCGFINAFGELGPSNRATAAGWLIHHPSPATAATRPSRTIPTEVRADRRIEVASAGGSMAVRIVRTLDVRRA